MWRSPAQGWQQTAKVGGTTTTASAATNTSRFGFSVAASGPFVVSLSHEGGAFAHYTPVPAMASLRAPSGLNGRDLVGTAVAAKGGMVLVGVPGNDRGGAFTDEFGVAYVVQGSKATWGFVVTC